MNGSSDLHDVQSFIFRSPSSRFSHEKRYEYGEGSWHLLRIRFLPSAHDLIVLCAKINARYKKIPDTSSVIKQGLIHNLLFLLLIIIGGNAFAAELTPKTLPPSKLWDIVVVECIERFFAPKSVPPPGPPSPEPLQIVVGCRLTNCGLQAQAHSPIEVRISLKSDLVASTAIDIENMSTVDKAGIEILQGKVDRRDSLQWTIGPGVTRLRGFSVPREIRPPVITFRPLPDEARVLALRQRVREARDLGSQDIGKIEIDIEQWLDNLLISRKRILVKLGFCEAESKHPQDQLTLKNHSGTPNPTVLLNGHRSNGCIDSNRRAAVETHTGNSTILLGNMLSNDSCDSEVSIFLEDRAMHLKVIDSNLPTWTNDPTDIVPVDMQPPPIRVPVNLWVLWPDEGFGDPQQGAEATKNAAMTDLHEANTLYGNTQSGIQFFMPSGLPEVRIDEEFWSATCADVESQTLTQVGYVPSQLNVYYVGRPPQTESKQATGWHCVTENENVIIIRAAIKRRATLAHELGHALSLQSHAENRVGEMDENGNQVFDAKNIMWGTFNPSQIDNRSKLTKGQSFRANVYEGSALYRMRMDPPLKPVKPAVVPGRDCTESDKSAQCPWIGAD